VGVLARARRKWDARRIVGAILVRQVRIFRIDPVKDQGEKIEPEHHASTAPTPKGGSAPQAWWQSGIILSRLASTTSSTGMEYVGHSGCAVVHDDPTSRRAS